MAKSLPPLTWFRAFEAAGRHLSFTAAAEEIGMTQSAVSQQVKALESRLRVALFTRHARGLSLTDDGRRLLPQVTSSLGQLAAATESYDTGSPETLLTVASSISVLQWVISPNLHDFQTRHPDIRLRFLSAVWPDEFLNARADVEIRFGSAKQAGKDARLLTPNALIALKAPSLVGSIDTLPLIETVGTSGGWKVFGQTQRLDLKPSLFADSYGLALQLAASGNGVALVSELLADHALRQGTLQRAHPASVEGQEGYYLSITQSAQARLFSDWLLDLIAR